MGDLKCLKIHIVFEKTQFCVPYDNNDTGITSITKNKKLFTVDFLREVIQKNINTMSSTSNSTL